MEFLTRWLNPLMKLGTKKELQIEDLYQALPEDEAEKLGLKLQKYFYQSLYSICNNKELKQIVPFSENGKKNWRNWLSAQNIQTKVEWALV